MATYKKLANGKYKGTVYIGKVDGKYVRRSVTADTKKECKRLCAEIEMDVDLHKFINMEKQFIPAWCDKWLELNKNAYAPSTLRGYKQIIEANFKPYFKNYRIKDLSILVMKDYETVKLETQSKKTVHDHTVLFKRIIRDALKERSPVEDYEPVSFRAYKPHIVTDEEVEKIINLYKNNLTYSLVCKIAIYGGLRRGEIFALKPQNIKQYCIEVREALSCGEDDAGLKKYHESNTKSEKGVRDVIVPESLIKELASYASRKKITSLSNRIFDINPDTFTNKFIEDIKGIGLNFRFHDLRHYQATWMYNEGIPDHYAAERMGHDVKVLKGIYQHLGLKKKEEINEILRRKLNGVSE